jgi:KTSC domain
MTLIETALVPVASTLLANVGYDRATSTLDLEFRDGSLYRYSAVSEAIYQGLLAADSKGSYFNRQIRSRFAYTLVRRPR